MRAQRRFAAALVGSLALGLALALLSQPALAKGTLHTEGVFGAKGATLHVITYTSVEGKLVGLLGIDNAGKRNSIAFALAVWPGVMELSRKAAAAQGPAWTSIGELAETETRDISHLRLRAGPGVEFVITSPQGLTVTAVVPTADVPRLEAALRAVHDNLVAGATAPAK